MQQENNSPPSKRQKNMNSSAWVELWDSTVGSWQPPRNDGDKGRVNLAKDTRRDVTDKTGHDNVNESIDNLKKQLYANINKSISKRKETEIEDNSKTQIAKTIEAILNKNNKEPATRNTAKPFYKYRCHLCAFRCGTNKRLLLQHLKSHGVDNNIVPRKCIIAKCTLCGATVTEGYKTHLELYHKDVINKQIGLAPARNQPKKPKFNSNTNNERSISTKNYAQMNTAIDSYVNQSNTANNGTHTNMTNTPQQNEVAESANRTTSLSSVVQRKANGDSPFATNTKLAQLTAAQAASLADIEATYSTLSSSLSPAIAAFTDRVASASVAFISGLCPKATVMNSIAAASAAFVSSVVLARDAVVFKNDINSATLVNNNVTEFSKTDTTDIKPVVISESYPSNTKSSLKEKKVNLKDKCVICSKRYKNMKKHISLIHGIDDVEGFMSLILMHQLEHKNG